MGFTEVIRNGEKLTLLTASNTSMWGIPQGATLREYLKNKGGAER